MGASVARQCSRNGVSPGGQSGSASWPRRPSKSSELEEGPGHGPDRVPYRPMREAADSTKVPVAGGGHTGVGATQPSIESLPPASVPARETVILEVSGTWLDATYRFGVTSGRVPDTLPSGQVSLGISFACRFR
jgi:hypothetical protein